MAMIGFGRQNEGEDVPRRVSLEVIHQRTAGFGITAIVADFRDCAPVIGGFLDFWTWTLKLSVRVGSTWNK